MAPVSRAAIVIGAQSLSYFVFLYWVGQEHHKPAATGSRYLGAVRARIQRTGV
jgi:hypothetical protein